MKCIYVEYTSLTTRVQYIYIGVARFAGQLYTSNLAFSITTSRFALVERYVYICKYNT